MARFVLATLAAITSLAVPFPSLSQDMEGLREQDARLAIVAGKVLRANAPLCDRTMQDPGIVIHSIDQYRSETTDFFPKSHIAVADVVPDSPAASAGLVAGEQIAAIGSSPVDVLEPEGGHPARDLAFDILADQPLGVPLVLTAIRDDRRREFVLPPSEACRLLVEITTEDDYAARTDGKVLQVTYPLANAIPNEQLAAVVAHELAHYILRHRVRLESAGVKGGLLRELGRNRTLGRRVENEADLLSIHLMRIAGYDPQAAVDFWGTKAGKKVGGGLFRSAIYQSPARRADALRDEIRRYTETDERAERLAAIVSGRENPL